MNRALGWAVLWIVGRALSVAAQAPAASASDAIPIVREVRVAVTPPGDEGAIRAYLGSQVGRPFDRLQVSDDVRALEKTGRFAAVAVRAEERPDGVALVFDVRYRLRVARLEITGADHLSHAKARELLGVQLGDGVDEAVLAAGAQRLRNEYVKKYFPRARASWAIRENPDGATAQVTVTVREGPRARVREIGFDGNQALPAATLRAGLTQRVFHPYNLWHWLAGVGRFDEDAVADDRYALRQKYLDAGYLDAQVRAPGLDAGGGALRIRFPIVEGPRYEVAAVGVTGVSQFPVDQVLAAVKVRPGALASDAAIRAGAEAILDLYGNAGYGATDVRSVVDPAAEPGRVTVRYDVREGPLTRIRTIRIRGNRLTRDRVIRRELIVQPGDKFNRERIRRSETRVRNLGYFEEVHYRLEDTPNPAEQDIVFEVTEQSMGQAGAGVTFSSIDDLSTYVEFQHGNFDLSGWPPVGAGQKLRLRAMLGTRRTDVELSFIEPYFLDRRLQLGVDAFRHENRYDSREYDIRRTGGDVSLTHPLNAFYRATLSLGMERIDIFNLDADVSDIIRQEEGERWKHDLTLSLTHDSRDRVFIPTRGNFSRVSAGVAGGWLGGDTDWYRLEAQSQQYFPLWGGTVFMLRGRAGVVEEYGDADRVPIFDRYFLGGANTVRGFKYRRIGPHDEDSEPLGGRSMAFASAEYTVPLHERVRLAAFVDGGMVWAEAYDFDLDWNSSYGVGVRFDIPMLPLRLDYSWPLNADDWNEDRNGRFSFMIGYGY